MNRAAALSKSTATSDAAAFESLMRTYYKRIYNVAYRMTGNAQDAEDLVQEAFMRAYRSFSSYKPGLPFQNWIYRIMSNLHIDRFRKQSKLRTVSLDARIPQDEGHVTFEIPDWTDNPEQAALAQELAEAIQTGLAQLPANFRMAVVLVDIEGLSYEETAEVMGTSIGTVRSRVFRGRQIVRDRVGRYLNQGLGDTI
jgi:RNA polymerase sigma-70 factor (ECF subfamily)